MKITIEITDNAELEKVLAALKALKADHMEVNTQSIHQTSITKGDKSVDAKDLFGIWKKKPKTLAEIRKKAWERS